MLCLTNIKAEDKKAVNAPENIKAVFTKEYANATKVKWEKEDGKYEVTFFDGEVIMSAVYTSDGMKIETETRIDIAKLPAAAREYAEKKGKIQDADLIVKRNGIINYEAKVKGKDYIFDQDGKFIKIAKD